ncbi:MAG: hypothetical protein V3U37_04675, partial [Nitrospinaceae bacterium]
MYVDRLQKVKLCLALDGHSLQKNHLQTAPELVLILAKGLVANFYGKRPGINDIIDSPLKIRPEQPPARPAVHTQ